MKPRVAGSSPAGREIFFMVNVAQLVELRIVIPAVVGSNPIVHPIFVYSECFSFQNSIFLVPKVYFSPHLYLL